MPFHKVFLKPNFISFSGDCDFEDGKCTWSNTLSGDQFDWLRRKSSTPSLSTGPSQDHTRQDASGNVCSWIIKGELKPDISLLHMKVLTLIKTKSNLFLWYVQCYSCTRRSKTKILTTRAPPSWIEFDVVTSHRQIRHLEYGLWLLISMFLRLLISCKNQKNRLRV